MKWCATTIGRLLENEKYKGAMLMQKTFTVNYLTRQHMRNIGQLNQYYIENDHPAIVSPEDWEAVQEEIARRRHFRKEHGLRGMSGGVASPFYARLFCERCGGTMQRIFHKGVRKPYWYCKVCESRIEEEALREMFCAVFNQLVMERGARVARWEEMRLNGSALQRVRGRQMIEITASGTIPYEVPELTQAVLQEAWLGDDGAVRFQFLSGERMEIKGGR